MTSSNTPMAMVPRASQSRSPVIAASATPTSAKARPTSAPRSSSSTTGSSGLFAVRTKRHHDWSPLIFLDSTMAVRKLKPSATKANSRMPIATPGLVSSPPWPASWSLWKPS